MGTAMWHSESHSKLLYQYIFACRHLFQRIIGLVWEPWSLLHHLTLGPHWDPQDWTDPSPCLWIQQITNVEDVGLGEKNTLVLVLGSYTGQLSPLSTTRASSPALPWLVQPLQWWAKGGAVLQLHEGLISHTYTLGSDPLTFQSAAADEAQEELFLPHDLHASSSTCLGRQWGAISPPPITPQDKWGSSSMLATSGLAHPHLSPLDQMYCAAFGFPACCSW